MLNSRQKGEKMIIIDWEKKGNLVRFYLGDKDDKDYWGDDWNDTPYEHNAGRVYEKYITGFRDVVFPYDYLVCEPADDWHYNGSPYSKEDMKKKKCPCICALKYDPETFMEPGYIEMSADYNAVKFYFGEEMSPSDEITVFTDKNSLV